MVIPHRNPGKSSVTQLQIGVVPVGCETLTIIVQSVDLAIWKRYTVNALTITIVAILILIDIVSQVKDVIHRVLPSRIAVGIEVAEWIVAARVDRQADLGNRIVGGWCCFCPTQIACNV